VKIEMSVAKRRILSHLMESCGLRLDSGKDAKQPRRHGAKEAGRDYLVVKERPLPKGAVLRVFDQRRATEILG
jgi:hypothetical protein